MARRDGDSGVGFHIGFVDDERAIGPESCNGVVADTLARAVCMNTDPEAPLCFLALRYWSHRSRRALGNDIAGSSRVGAIELLVSAATTTTSIALRDCQFMFRYTLGSKPTHKGGTSLNE